MIICYCVGIITQNTNQDKIIKERIKKNLKPILIKKITGKA